MRKEFIVLSIYEGHMASASIMIDGEVVAASHEERFTRIKNDVGFPLQAAQFCLRAAGVRPEEVTAVAMVTEFYPGDSVAAILFKRPSSYSIEDFVEENNKYWKPKIVEGKDPGSYFNVMGGWERVGSDHHYELSGLNFEQPSLVVGEKFNEIRCDVVENLLGISRSRVKFMPHYMCHHYHAYYSGEFRGPDVVVIHAESDGGDYNQAVSQQTAAGLQIVGGTNKFNLGRLYQWTTLLLGMKPLTHEYKLMGLASHANRHEVERSLAVFERIFQLVPEKLAIEFKEKPSDLYFYFKEALTGHRFDGIAGALQQVLEDRLREWVQLVIDVTKADRVAFGGGVAMNVKANMRIAHLDAVKDFFVPLSPADESNVFGAGYGLTEQHFIATGRNPDSLPPLKTPYLGREFRKNDIEIAANAAKSKGYEVKDGISNKNISELLARGNIIGRCQGRSEFGQRALGNRSILAHPSISGTVDKINRQIKYRDFWMPFAPSILDTHFTKYLHNEKALYAPYMTVAFQSRQESSVYISEALHQSDLTARPQVVEDSLNSEYFKLIRSFETETGIGALLNTSFNLHGKPIVDLPLEAFHVFDYSELDGLWFGDILVSRSGS